jgi:TIR domain-containing protein
MSWMREIAGMFRSEWGNKPAGKIFISYRRADSPGIAGRLSDSLTEYFGDERVFRDIEDIEKGAKFGDAIDSTVESADALVVLIGPEWLDARNAEGGRRLDDEDDWVAREIAAACRRDLRVFPVLIEGTSMPRAEELPESIRPLAGYNAMSIADSRWRHDVTRLAKVISFDLPGSAVERKLEAINRLICLMLFLAIGFTTITVAWNALHEQSLLSQAQAAASYVFIFPASVLLLIFSKDMDPSSKVFATAGGLVGFVGSGLSIVALNLIPSEAEPLMLFVVSTVLITAMLGLMSLSGFRPRW